MKRKSNNSSQFESIFWSWDPQVLKSIPGPWRSSCSLGVRTLFLIFTAESVPGIATCLSRAWCPAWLYEDAVETEGGGLQRRDFRRSGVCLWRGKWGSVPSLFVLFSICHLHDLDGFVFHTLMSRSTTSLRVKANSAVDSLMKTYKLEIKIKSFLLISWFFYFNSDRKLAYSPKHMAIINM